jgi:hypothetical protein
MKITAVKSFIGLAPKKLWGKFEEKKTKRNLNFGFELLPFQETAGYQLYVL